MSRKVIKAHKPKENKKKLRKAEQQLYWAAMAKAKKAAEDKAIEKEISHD